MNSFRPNLLLVLFFSAMMLGVTPSSRVPEASTRLPPSSHSFSGRVFTLLDYFRSGRNAVDSFLESDVDTGATEELAAVIRRCQAACAQVEVRFMETASAYQSVRGSGVLVDGGRKILTAGHSLQDGDGFEIVVTFHNGEVRRARLLAHEYRIYGGAGHDWAVMEILGPPVTSIPSVELGEAVEGGLAIVLGYPDQIGISAAGEVAHISEAGSFLPLVTLSTVLERDPLLLSPTAGSIPVGGMSGGPIFNRQGRLVGIFSSVARIVQSSGVTYVYNGAPLESLPQWQAFH